METASIGHCSGSVGACRAQFFSIFRVAFLEAPARGNSVQACGFCPHGTGTSTFVILLFACVRGMKAAPSPSALAALAGLSLR